MYTWPWPIYNIYSDFIRALYRKPIVQWSFLLTTKRGNISLFRMCQETIAYHVTLLAYSYFVLLMSIQSDGHHDHALSHSRSSHTTRQEKKKTIQHQRLGPAEQRLP